MSTKNLVNTFELKRIFMAELGPVEDHSIVEVLTYK